MMNDLYIKEYGEEKGQELIEVFDSLDKEAEEARTKKDFDYNRLDYGGMAQVIKSRPKIK